MAPRRRGPRYRDLPPNCEADPKPNGRVYYRYVAPDGQRMSLGSDKAVAISAAIELNLTFSEKKDLVAKVLGRQHVALPSPENPTLPILVAEFQTHVLAERRHSDRTREEITYKLNEYCRIWPERLVKSFTVRDIATFLSEKTANVHTKHRLLLDTLFAFACQQGYRNDNPAANLLKKRQPDRVRQRHTLEGYRQIHAVAPDWMKRAMDIALRSLQRRGDLTALRREQVDLAKNTITIRQKKTRNFREPVFIEIEMGPELRKAVEACLASNIPCPFLLHTRPKRITAQVRQAKEHVFALTDQYLSKAFSKYRDLAGAYSHLSQNERPTFHDLRALGIWLYQQAGHDDEYISALSGHSTERMLAHYKAGHETVKPRKVRADLSIPKQQTEE